MLKSLCFDNFKMLAIIYIHHVNKYIITTQVHRVECVDVKKFLQQPSDRNGIEERFQCNGSRRLGKGEGNNSDHLLDPSRFGGTVWGIEYDLQYSRCTLTFLLLNIMLK